MFGGRYFGGRHFGARYFGKEGITVPGYYNGSRYFGSRYFGARYFGANSTEIPFELVTTNTPALSGSVQISGDVLSGVGFDLAVTTGLALSGVVSTSGALLYEGDDWAFTPPLSINELTGALVVAGDVTFTLGATEAGSHFGGAYFGQAYFGRRYWATKAAFALEQTNTLALSGSVQVGGDIIAATSVVQSGAVAFTGTLGLTGDLTFPSFNYTSAGCCTCRSAWCRRCGVPEAPRAAARLLGCHLRGSRLRTPMRGRGRPSVTRLGIGSSSTWPRRG